MNVKTKQGGVLIEFMMVISIFLTVAFVGFELSSCMQQRRFAMSLSKEIANSVYKDCPDMIDRQAQQLCLQTTLDQFNKVSSIHTNGTFFRVGVHWNFAAIAGSGGLDPSAMFFFCDSTDVCSVSNPTENVSKFSLPAYNNTVGPPIAVPLQISVDLAVRYTPIITSVASLFGLENGTFFYARTIL